MQSIVCFSVNPLIILADIEEPSLWASSAVWNDGCKKDEKLLERKKFDAGATSTGLYVVFKMKWISCE